MQKEVGVGQVDSKLSDHIKRKLAHAGFGANGINCHKAEAIDACSGQMKDWVEAQFRIE